MKARSAQWFAAAAFVVVAAGCPGRPSWVRGDDLTYGTAHTLEEGRYEIGIFTPFQIGISDRFHAAIHPILSFVAPSVSLRYHFYDGERFDVAANVGVIWSFLGEEDADEHPIADDQDCAECGFPGLTQLTATASWEPLPGLMISAGVGPALDWLDLKPVRFMVEIHLSVLGLIDSEHLVMLHTNAYLDTTGGPVLRRPVLQVSYAHDWDGFVAAFGVAVGEFPVKTGQEEIERLPVYPVIDFWWRL